MLKSQLLRPLSFLFLCFAAAPAPAQVWNVGGPNADFTDIQAAVNAVGEGDTLRVWPGTYPRFQVDGKDVQIVATGPGVVVNRAVRVHNLAPGQAVFLFGLQVRGIESAALRLDENLGHVRISGCDFVGDDGFAAHEEGFAGVSIDECSDVVMTSCTMRGGNAVQVFSSPAGPPAASGGAGVSIFLSTVAIYDSALSAGDGASVTAGAADGGRGGDGLGATVSTLFLSGCEFAGGHGGDTQNGTGGDGGDGVNIEDFFVTHLYELDNLFFPGDGGAGGPMDPSGAPGASIEAPAVDSLVGSARSLRIPPLTPESSLQMLSFLGEPGDEVFLVVSLVPGFLFERFWNGPLTLGFPIIGRIFVGTIPFDGQLDALAAFGDVPDFDSLPLGFQAAFVDTQGRIYLGAPATTVVTGAAF